MKFKLAKKKIIIITSIITILIISVIAIFNVLDSKKVITICTDEAMQNSVESFVLYYNEVIDNSVEFKVTVLPNDNQERETQIKKLRTELMAGNGKDIYLMTDRLRNQSTQESIIPFIEDVNKTLYAGVWADLSKYVEEDEGYKNCFEPIMKAGQVDGKQYILPLTFDCKVVQVSDKYAEGIKYDVNYGKTSLLSLIENGSEINNSMLFSLIFSPQSFIGSVIDYKNSQLNVTEEEIRKIIDYGFENYKEDEWVKGFSVIDITREFDTTYQKLPTFTYYPMVTINGDTFANVKSYGAISRNCKEKDKAYKFLSLYLSDGFMSGNGVTGQKLSDEKYSINVAWGDVNYLEGVPVNKKGWRNWFTAENAENSEDIKEHRQKYVDKFINAMEQINSCQFYNYFDRQAHKIDELFLTEKGYKTSFDDLEKRIEKEIGIIYDNLKYSAFE